MRMPPFQVAFADLPDPRVDRTTDHRLLDSVAIAVCAGIGGADRWVAVEEVGTTKQTWLPSLRDLPTGMPSHATCGRVVAALDADQLHQGLRQGVRAVWPSSAGEVVAVDGTTVRGSHDRGIGTDAIQLVSAWAGQARVVLAHRKVDATSNEMTAIPPVVRLRERKGCPVTLAALGCQPASAQQSVPPGADDVRAVQENQEQLDGDRVATFRYAPDEHGRGVAHMPDRTVTGDHGRIERRDEWLIHAPDVRA